MAVINGTIVKYTFPLLTIISDGSIAALGNKVSDAKIFGVLLEVLHNQSAIKGLPK